MTAGAGGYENTGPKKSFSLWKTLGAFQPHVMARRREWPAWRAMTRCVNMYLGHGQTQGVACLEGHYSHASLRCHQKRFSQFDEHPPLVVPLWWPSQMAASIVTRRPNPNLGFAAALDFHGLRPITMSSCTYATSSSGLTLMQMPDWCVWSVDNARVLEHAVKMLYSSQ